MTLKKKIFLGFSSILILMAFVVSISAFILHKQYTDMDEIVLNRYEKIKLAAAVENERSFSAKSIRDILLDPSTFSPQEVSLIENSRAKALDVLQSLLQIEENEEKRKLVLELQRTNQAYEEDVKEVLALLQAGKKDEAVRLFLTEDQKKIRNDIQLQSFALQDIEHQAMSELLNRSAKTYWYTIILIVLLLVIALLIGIVVTLWVIRGFNKSVNRVSSVIASVSQESTGQLPRIQVISNDEIGEISRAFNQMVDTIEAHARQKEELNQALTEQNWIETQLAEITTSFQGIHDLETLAGLLITKLTPLIEAQYGVFYRVRGEEKEECLTSIATYAHQGIALPGRSFHLGEGLVGQCALDRRPIILHDLPENYVTIRSGIGEAAPRCLYLLPILFEGKVLAVLEFASFSPFSPLHQKLLERISGSLGITIHSVTRQMEIKNLLEQSQSLTEELQTQSEELQMQHEELRTINEQLEKQYRESELKTQELEETKQELEEQAKQLAISSQFKSEFLANMSHELRTPLNSMLILAQIFAENREGNLTEKQVEYAHSIHSAGKDLLNLINDILDLSKVESGKMEIHPDEVDLLAIQRELEHQFLPVANQKGLLFRIESLLNDNTGRNTQEDASENGHFKLRTDEHRLKQILKNLLSNAFKFTETGQVILRFRNLRGQYRPKDKSPCPDAVIAISVTDTGIGIPQDKQEMIFEAFRQADGTISRRHGGTGLGLSISRELAQLLGGALEVESEVGKGSTFTLYLRDLAPSPSACPLFKGQPPQTTELKPGALNLALAHEVASSLNIASVHEADPAREVSSSREMNEGVSTENRKTGSEAPFTAKQAPFTGKKVLIVDDDMRNVFALTVLLEQQGMAILFAENGKEALDTLKANPDIDLVLMDIMMPEMDGFTTMRAIRKIPEFKTLPIIALTAKAMKNDRDKCIEAGASDYISKPINVDQFLSLIRVWLYQSENK